MPTNKKHKDTENKTISLKKFCLNKKSKSIDFLAKLVRLR